MTDTATPVAGGTPQATPLTAPAAPLLRRPYPEGDGPQVKRAREAKEAPDGSQVPIWASAPCVPAPNTPGHQLATAAAPVTPPTPSPAPCACSAARCIIHRRRSG